MARGMKTQGTLLHYSLGSPTSMVKVGRVVDFDGPGGDSTIIPDTDLDVTDAMTKLAGLVDSGQFNVRVRFDPDAVDHLALKDAQDAGTLLELRLTLPSGTKKYIHMRGYVRSFRLAGPADASVGAAISVELDGKWWWSASA